MNIIFNLCGPVNVFVKSCELDVYYELSTMMAET